LAREEAVHGVLVHPQDAADPHGVKAAVVDQAANRLRMDAQLAGDLTHAVQARLRIRSHNVVNICR